jgi:hypothetical protein
VSDIPNLGAQLDLRVLLVKLDRDMAETHKLLAEANKFNREPFVLIASAIGAALIARLPEILHAFGWGH